MLTSPFSLFLCCVFAGVPPLSSVNDAGTLPMKWARFIPREWIREPLVAVSAALACKMISGIAPIAANRDSAIDARPVAPHLIKSVPAFPLTASSTVSIDVMMALLPLYQSLKKRVLSDIMGIVFANRNMYQDILFSKQLCKLIRSKFQLLL